MLVKLSTFVKASTIRSECPPAGLGQRARKGQYTSQVAEQCSPCTFQHHQLNKPWSLGEAAPAPCLTALVKARLKQRLCKALMETWHIRCSIPSWLQYAIPISTYKGNKHIGSSTSRRIIVDTFSLNSSILLP